MNFKNNSNFFGEDKKFNNLNHSVVKICSLYENGSNPTYVFTP